MPWLHPLEKEDLPHGPFLWKGYDGSTVKALRVEDDTIYCSQYGHAKENIIRKEKYYDDQDDILILWGVGNHGGVSSMKDLEDIAELQAEKKGEWKILHTTLENYFAAVSPAAVYDKQLVCFTKTYSSVSGIKQAHDELENTLYLAEKTCSVAELLTDFRYDKEVFKKAEKTLCQIEFHDIFSESLHARARQKDNVVCKIIFPHRMESVDKRNFSMMGVKRAEISDCPLAVDMNHVRLKFVHRTLDSVPFVKPHHSVFLRKQKRR